ncbi:MAG: hypothetical protein ISS15_03055 [Alphaproteobacteria bacterium]|nr:hypothetical protein [Alphaproteobacteria bacterium]MBL6939096.1 hypothetical protein [Alphaproteobacteria bacterium]MBL7096613.1 hypothetical protein [Alphaproteobacteria bacterium]
MAKLSYTRDEILADHDYASPQIEDGYRLHGGFDGKGNYISPRTLNRWPAVEAWQEALKARGGTIIDASRRLLKRGPYPTADQQKFLLGHGFDETLWNSLTVTGIIEARGAMLAQADAPDFQKIVVEDIAETCLGHLNKGLLAAHGYDEGGQKALGIGGHDDMWFAVRDALFGKNAYPIPEVPASISRPETGRRIPEVPEKYEQWILLLMNVLMIEVKAESFFSFCQSVMRDPENFADRRAAANHAADLVERIRTDEAIHVAYLATVISELHGLTIKTVDGKIIPGATIIDPVWNQMIEWHAVTQANFGREQSREAIIGRLKVKPNGAALAASFDRLEFRQAAE